MPYTNIKEKRVNKYEVAFISILTGNNEKYINDVMSGKIPQPSVKNNYWGLGADKYYQGIIEGVTKSFRRLFTFIYIILAVFIVIALILK